MEKYTFTSIYLLNDLIYRLLHMLHWSHINIKEGINSDDDESTNDD